MMKRPHGPRRRQLLALGALGVTLALLVLLGLGHELRRTRRHQWIRAQGIAAINLGAPAEARQLLDFYVRAHPDDVQVLHAFAAAQLALPQANGAHLQHAALSLTRALDLQPQDQQVALDLIAIWRQQGQTAAALALADRLMHQRPEEPRVLRLHAELSAQGHDWPTAWNSANHLLRQAPLDPVGTVTLLSSFQAAGMPAELLGELLNVARREALPPGATALLTSLQQEVAGDASGAARTLLDTPTTAIDSPELALLLVAQLRRHDQCAAAGRVLAELAWRLDEPTLWRQWVQTLYLAEQTSELVRLWEQWWQRDPQAAPLPVLCGGVLALTQLQRGAEAAVTLAQITRRAEREPVAAAWLTLLTTPAPPLRQLQESAGVLRWVHPDDVLPQVLLAQQWARAGEWTAGSAALRHALQVDNCWDAGRVQLVETLLWQQDYAGAAAELALLPRRAADLPRAAHLRELLALLLEEQPGLVLQAAAHWMEPATTAALTEAEVALVIGKLRATPGAGEMAQAWLEQARTRWPQSAALAELAAEQMLADQGADAAWALFRDVEQRLDWLCAQARVWEQVDEQEALRRWRQLAQSNPRLMPIQRALLALACRTGDARAAGSALAALREELGPAASSWRLAEARWLLDEAPAEPAAQIAAARHIHAVLALYPHDAQAAALLQRLGGQAAAEPQS